MIGGTADAGHPLSFLFHPRSIALVGATARENSVGRAVLENLMGGFTGRIHPVNSKSPEVLGLRTHPSLADIPSPVDLAILAVPSTSVPGVLEECGRLAIRSVVILSAGFRECGAEGAVLEWSVVETAKAHGISVIGPNCLGVINTDPEVAMNATFARRVPRPGPISFLSQSGALGVYALEYAAGNDFGLRYFASLGNKAVLHENHVLDAFAADEGTRVILAYLEDLKDPGAFLERAAAIARGPAPKPIVLLKAGTGRSGGRAAASHTGALAEKADFLNDLCSQYGIVRAANLEDMFNYARYFSGRHLPKGPRLGVLTNAGGPAILAADEAERQGLVLPEPSVELKRNLRASLPAAAGLANPIDVLGDSDAARYRNILNTMVSSREFDAILALCTPQRMTPVEGMAAAIADAAEGSDAESPVLIASLASFEEDAQAARILGTAGVPNFGFAENAAKALGAAWRHSRWLRMERRFPDRPGLDRAAVRKRLDLVRREKCVNLTEPESEGILKAYGLPVAESVFVDSAETLAGAIAGPGFPLVAKIVSPDILHKVDAGGVIAGIDDADALVNACSTLLDNAERFRPGAAIHGVLLQSMVRGGTEFLIGGQRHPLYGPLLLFGLGGTMVEAIHDVRFGRAPLTGDDALEMIRGIRAAEVLDRFRGKPPRDVEALMDCLFRLSWLMEDFPEIAEVDLNPVFGLEQGARIADARMVLFA